MGLQQSWKLDQKLVTSMVWHYNTIIRASIYSKQISRFTLQPSLLPFDSKRGWVTHVSWSMLCYAKIRHTWRTKRRNFWREVIDSNDRRNINLTMSKSVKKLVEETKEQGYTELDLCDKSLSTIADIPGLSKCTVYSWKQKNSIL